MKDKGLVIDKDNPVLALSVDGEVSDPTNKYHPIGTLRQNTSYWGPLASGFSWETANRKPQNIT